MKSDNKDIASMLRRNYELNDAQIENVIKYANRLSKRSNKANDFALAYYLNQVITDIFVAVRNSRYSELDSSKLNRNYILIRKELEELYRNNLSLEYTKGRICWQEFNQLETIESDYLRLFDSDKVFWEIHQSEIKSLCISHGREKPNIPERIKRLVDESTRELKEFTKELDIFRKKQLKAQLKIKKNREWIIPEYFIEHRLDGTILVNYCR